MSGIQFTTFGTIPKISALVIDKDLDLNPYRLKAKIVSGALSGDAVDESGDRYIALNCYYDGSNWRAITAGQAGILAKTVNGWMVLGTGEIYSPGGVVNTGYGNIAGKLVAAQMRTTAGTSLTVKKGSKNLPNCPAGEFGPVVSATVPNSVVNGSSVSCVLTVGYNPESWGIVVKKNGETVYTGGANTLTYDLTISAGDAIEIYGKHTVNGGSPTLTGYVKIDGYTPFVDIVTPTW